MSTIISEIVTEQLEEENLGHDAEARRMIERHNRQKKLERNYRDWHDDVA